MGSTERDLTGIRTSLKILATCYILGILAGYSFSIVKIYEHSRFSMEEAVLYYRGDDSGESLRVPQSFGGMLSVAHVHSMSQPFLFAILGFIFAFARRSEAVKSFFFILAFSGMMGSNAAPWLIRYHSPHMVALLPLSQAAIFLSITGMSALSLYDLWLRRK